MASRNTSSNARQNVQRSNRDSARWIAGLLLLCVGIFAAAAVFFSFFSWAEDQSVLQKTAEDRELLGAEIENPCGPLGARLGRLLVDGSFGVFGILIPVMLILIGIRIIRQQPIRFNQSILSLFFIMILGSLTLGYLFDARWSLCSSTGWGGAFGNLLASRHPIDEGGAIGLLPGAIGSLGTLILLVGGWILTGVFINRNFINKVNRAGNVLVDQSERIVDTVRSKVVHARPEESDESFDVKEGEDVERSGDIPAAQPQTARRPEVSAAEAPRTSGEQRAQTGYSERRNNLASGLESGTERSTAERSAENMPEREIHRTVRPEGEDPVARRGEDRSVVPPLRNESRRPDTEESPFVELTPDGRPIEPSVADAHAEDTTDEEFTEVDLSHSQGRVVMGRGGLVELERPQPRRTQPEGAATPGKTTEDSDEPFIEITVGDDRPDTPAPDAGTPQKENNPSPEPAYRVGHRPP